MLVKHSFRFDKISRNTFLDPVPFNSGTKWLWPEIRNLCTPFLVYEWSLWPSYLISTFVPYFSSLSILTNSLFFHFMSSLFEHIQLFWLSVLALLLGSLGCCSPWGHKESDTTEQLNWAWKVSASCLWMLKMTSPCHLGPQFFFYISIYFFMLSFASF